METGLRFALLAVVAVLAVGLAGCGGEDEEEPAAGEATATTTATTDGAAAPPVTVDLSEQSGSGQTGTATLEPIDDSTTVTLALSNSPADPQPAHIHSGTCAELGDVVHPLTNVEGGSSETEVAAPLADLQTGAFAINVHASEADIETYVACGDIPAS